jgi:O-antigen/teichoic acid export membrane protein
MKKGILQIFFANVINLFLGIVTGFILPKYLPIDEYGFVKTFQLYISYIGFLHLGYVDGIYLLYGGKNIESVPIDEMTSRIRTFKLFQICVSICFLGASFLLRDWVLIAFSLSILPYNLGTYYKYFYQAVGEFKKYSLIMNLSSLFSAIGMLGLIIFKIKNSKAFVFVFLASYILIAILADLSRSVHYKVEKKNILGIKDNFQLIKSGFVLMLGNFTATLMTGLDRWCVKLMIPNINDFSYYSFAVSLQAMLDAFVSPITIVFYNYLCNEWDCKIINRLKRICLLFGCVLMAVAFPCKWIVEHFIQNYVASIRVLFVLFSAEVLYLLIRGIYVNLYKARMQQKIYFKKMVYVIVVALILNILFFQIMPSKEAFAYATLISSFVWLILCMCDFKEVSLKVEESVVLVISVILFLILGELSNTYVSFGLYVLYLLVLSVVFFRDEVEYVLFKFIKKK